MEALAEALERAGTDVTTTPAANVRAASAGADLVMVDAYLLRADELPAGNGLVAAVDDLCRDLAVDIVVDPAPGARAEEHTRAKVVLAGARYAMIGTGHGTTLAPPASASVRSVLVTTGAADTAGTGKALAARLHDLLPDLIVRLVIGPWSGTDVPDGVEAVAAPNDLWDALAAADLVVTAGGVTMLESLRSGRPTVVVVTADNQRRQAEGAAAKGAARLVVPDEAPAAVVDLVGNGEERARLAAAAAALIDGKGPERVATALLGALARR